MNFKQIKNKHSSFTTLTVVRNQSLDVSFYMPQLLDAYTFFGIWLFYPLTLNRRISLYCYKLETLLFSGCTIFHHMDTQKPTSPIPTAGHSSCLQFFLIINNAFSEFLVIALAQILWSGIRITGCEHMFMTCDTWPDCFRLGHGGGVLVQR